jgi:polysaccharide pyruvyl transferase WcaK-like protein
LEPDNKERERLIRASDVWLGVGGTPFQATGGRWLLNHILADFDACPETPKFMVGVGSENEVKAEWVRAARVFGSVDRIWSRDQGSYNVLLDQFENVGTTVKKGGDLANIALQNIFSSVSNSSKHGEGIGLIVYKDAAAHLDTIQLRRSIQEAMSKQPVTFIANDVRRGAMEHAIFRKAFGGLRGLIHGKPRWMAPDYNANNTDDMVNHFLNYSTVLSARYHGLLTAAWAGCAVTALARSSKLTFLAEDLGISAISMEDGLDFINEGLEKAAFVPRNILNERALIAIDMLDDLKKTLLELVSNGIARGTSDPHV